MSVDSDVALLGTGIAPLVAANHLLIQGKSVLLLNPDWDFYLEDSELPLDPMVRKIPKPDQLSKSSPENALAVLRPEFPGAIEFWSNHLTPTGFHDSSAPHIRQRGRLWISSPDKNSLWDWEDLEDLYVEASDASLNPQILEGISAAKKFPGFSAAAANLKGLFLPKLCDIDSVRYRNGLLEYIRERIQPERLVCAVNSIEWMPEAVRFHSQGSMRTAKLREGMLVFWTPRLSSWILSQAKKSEVTPKLPLGIRVWEQWSLNSKEKIDPNTIGLFHDMAVWADFEGSPYNLDPSESSTGHKLAVLRSGPLVPLDGMQLPIGGLSWASAESFAALSSLCHGLLKWDRFSVRSMRARAIFEWGNEKPWALCEGDPLVMVIPGCDGPLMDIVRVARTACDLIGPKQKAT